MKIRQIYLALSSLILKTFLSHVQTKISNSYSQSHPPGPVCRRDFWNDARFRSPYFILEEFYLKFHRDMLVQRFPVPGKRHFSALVVHRAPIPIILALGGFRSFAWQPLCYFSHLLDQAQQSGQFLWWKFPFGAPLGQLFLAFVQPWPNSTPF